MKDAKIGPKGSLITSAMPSNQLSVDRKMVATFPLDKATELPFCKCFNGLVISVCVYVDELNRPIGFVIESVDDPSRNVTNTSSPFDASEISFNVVLEYLPKGSKILFCSGPGQYKLRFLYPIPEIWCLDADRQRPVSAPPLPSSTV